MTKPMWTTDGSEYVYQMTTPEVHRLLDEIQVELRKLAEPYGLEPKEGEPTTLIATKHPKDEK